MGRNGNSGNIISLIGVLIVLLAMGYILVNRLLFS